MINAKKTVAVCASVIGITAGMAVFLPATASAATYGGQCGKGYAVIDSRDLDGATAFLTYNGKTNCVVTVRDQPGKPVRMGAGLRRSGVSTDVVVDDAKYTEFAGPVKVDAKGECIDWGGLIGDDQSQVFRVHCG
ncbi:hypothetical protein OHB12_19500 [Nocardia sp. NBC_01730]|uniref:hypothetical protein n=1 Tax=Nocardia sp. NBC_01730 TaxID=2975998 RepID=UPI002E0E6F72|nr:hypothetical protein OHB12_19500 [Nocardia sp. NBC_01730]